ncbi:hypothetical protein JXM67_01160 [candidate division WOR-3 bacterium]|nr:hypothetical protein [candidate division WOR-3 bacterium]
MSEVIKELCKAFGPTGREASVATIVTRRLKDSGFSVRVDALGNVIGLRGKQPNRCLVFSAHMDQPGWVTEQRAKNGMLHVKPVPVHQKLGDGWAVDEENRRYRISRDHDGKALLAEELSEDSGSTGTFLVPDVAFEETSQAFYATALSDRLGASLLVQVAAEIPPSEESIAFIFYTGRHLKFTGLIAALEGIEAKRFYLIEGVPAEDDYQPGDGPCLLLRTSGSIAPIPSRKEVVSIAEEAGIKLKKRLCLKLGSAADVLARAGIPSIVLGLAVRYESSRIERISRSDYVDIKELVKLLAGFDCTGRSEL